MKHFPHDYISPRCADTLHHGSISCGKCPLSIPPSCTQLIRSCSEAHPECQVGRQVSLNAQLGFSYVAVDCLGMQPVVFSSKADIAIPEDAERSGKKPPPPKG